MHFFVVSRDLFVGWVFVFFITKVLRATRVSSANAGNSVKSDRLTDNGETSSVSFLCILMVQGMEFKRRGQQIHHTRPLSRQHAQHVAYMYNNPL